MLEAERRVRQSEQVIAAQERLLFMLVAGTGALLLLHMNAIFQGQIRLEQPVVRWMTLLTVVAAITSALGCALVLVGKENLIHRGLTDISRKAARDQTVIRQAGPPATTIALGLVCILVSIVCLCLYFGSLLSDSVTIQTASCGARRMGAPVQALLAEDPLKLG